MPSLTNMSMDWISPWTCKEEREDSYPVSKEARTENQGDLDRLHLFTRHV